MHENTGPYRMDRDAAERACAARGATSARQRAALMGISTATMYRYFEGRTPPRLDTVDAVCRNLGLSREVLFPGLSGAPDAAERSLEQVIAEYADKVAANWPVLSEAQRLEVARVMSAITSLPAQAPSRRLGRAA